MPRAIWTGAISFGLVTVPVRLYSAVNRKTVRFHQLSSRTGARVAQKRVDPRSEEEVPYESIVKGYELAPDRYVVIEPGELDALQPEKTRTIDIEDFVELEQIERVGRFKAARDMSKVERRLKQLADACRDGGNVMPVLVDAVKDYVSLGEISDVYRQAFGLYREPIIF